MRLEIQDLREELEESKVLRNIDIADITKKLNHANQQVKRLKENNRELANENQKIFKRYMNLEDEYNELLEKPFTISVAPNTSMVGNPPRFIGNRRVLERSSSLNNDIQSNQKYNNNNNNNNNSILRTHSLEDKRIDSLNLNSTTKPAEPKPSSIVMLCDILGEENDMDEDVSFSFLN